MTHKIEVVLVDKNDKYLGLMEKYKAHKLPVPLHRAISIVIFDKSKKKTLITLRANNKPTWPLYWSNTVCSHPYKGESYQDAAERRVYEELGFKTELTETFRFTYKAEMDNKVFGEHEYDVCFTGTYDGKIKPNPDEVADYKWIEIKKLKSDLIKYPNKFTPWFKLIANKLFK